MIDEDKDKDTVLDTFRDMDFTGIVKLALICIYKCPADYPGQYVARLWDLEHIPPRPTNYVVVADYLDAIRAKIPSMYSKLQRYDTDDPKIVETWF